MEKVLGIFTINLPVDGSQVVVRDYGDDHSASEIGRAFQSCVQSCVRPMPGCHERPPMYVQYHKTGPSPMEERIAVLDEALREERQRRHKIAAERDRLSEKFAEAPWWRRVWNALAGASNKQGR
jgi:hypothetical protein